MVQIISSEQVEKCEVWQAPTIKAFDVQTEVVIDPNNTHAALLAANEKLYQEGFEGGYKQGVSAAQSDAVLEAKAEAQAKYEKMWLDKINTAEAIINTLNKPVSLLTEAVESQVVLIAQILAERLARKALSESPEQLLSVIKEAQALLPVQKQVMSVKVHPNDYNAIKVLCENLDDTVLSQSLTKDMNLKQGDCMLETEMCTVDATVHHRIERLLSKEAYVPEPESETGSELEVENFTAANDAADSTSETTDGEPDTRE